MSEKFFIFILKDVFSQLKLTNRSFIQMRKRMYDEVSALTSGFKLKHIFKHGKYQEGRKMKTVDHQSCKNLHAFLKGLQATTS